MLSLEADEASVQDPVRELRWPKFFTRVLMFDTVRNSGFRRQRGKEGN
jgi:hypothetical protein